MEKLFIDKDVNVFSGIEAEKKMSEKNDKKYLKDGTILKVDKERWFEAQHYERKTWMENAINLSDDRNFEHHNRFNSYKDLENPEISNKIKKVIELGCGPFTNLRTFIHILPNIQKVDLLDPLLNDYLKHSYCSYKDCKIGNYESKCHSIPIEEFTTNEKYDLIIMNNVLEHCYDIQKIFDNILNILSDESYFVFSDVYFSKEDIENNLNIIYDAGHPIRVSKEIVDKFLSNFEVIYNKDFQGLYSQSWRNDKYFIGKLKK